MSIFTSFCFLDNVKDNSIVSKHSKFSRQASSLCYQCGNRKYLYFCNVLH